ncbi:Nucleosome-remodeling factor subunit NURF301-like protein [Trichuris trichiura]|uniref:Nucleosome-remodeling factor subunit NURF301-like protein n=1 Tax=Trichuris trichiura TaxID=36087 RepID=A0A077ZF30_TRITR|nr:Nucleosome-remodeling factor subunit NURF301-like protein [Trichuris trichiura]
MLRQSLHDLCLRFPETLMHPLWWREQRADWLKTLDNAERLETLINHLARFELLVRPSTLVEVWYQGLGYSRLWRQTAADREERNNQKARAREQQALDEPNENAVFAKYTVLNGAPKHQIWKLKHEQYRISGDGHLGGWIWIRHAVQPIESSIFVNLGLHSPLVNVSDGIRVHSVYFKKAKECWLLDSLLNTLECKREVSPFVAVQRGICDSRASCYTISCRVFGKYACYSPSCIENFAGSRFHLLGFGGRKRVEVEQPQSNVSSVFPPEPQLRLRAFTLSGIYILAKAGWNWLYPSPRPTVQTCWRLATQRTLSLHSVAFLWKEVLVKMPLQTKHVLRSETYNESREIIQHKDLPPFGLCCVYMTRYHRLADDLRSVNFLSSSELDDDDFISPEYAPGKYDFFIVQLIILQFLLLM